MQRLNTSLSANTRERLNLERNGWKENFINQWLLLSKLKINWTQKYVSGKMHFFLIMIIYLKNCFEKNKKNKYIYYVLIQANIW